jgi:hypothetical protein
MMAALENLAKRNKSRIQNEVARAASKESTDDVDDEKSLPHQSPPVTFWRLFPHPLVAACFLAHRHRVGTNCSLFGFS